MNINYTYSYTNNFVIINKIIISMNYFYEFLGIGDWGLGPIPNPPSPIPNPQSPKNLY